MQIVDMATSRSDGVVEVRFRATPSGAAEPFDLWYRFEGLDAPPDGLSEAAAAALLVPCMAVGEPLSLPGPLSPAFAGNIAQAQQVLCGWYEDLQPVEVAAPRDEGGPSRRADGVVCCFSAGVDSWYSLLKHEARVSHLLFVRGFDIGLDNDALWQAARRNAETVAQRLGKRLILGATNLRDVADLGRRPGARSLAGGFWGQRLHGAALASVGLLLRRTAGEVIIPATHSYAQMKPWGTSPLLDPLWSNGDIVFTHDGCEADRAAKVRRIVQSDDALATLRVCYADTPDINCGRCEKCVRTMLALRLYGALERTPTFPRPLPLSAVHRMIMPPHERHHYVALRKEARRLGRAEVLAATEILLRERPSAAQAAARLRQALRGTMAARVVRAAKRALGPAPVVAPSKERVDGAVSK